jgi:hypothetical protein
MLQNVNLQNILKANDSGDIHTRKGLNQEMGLVRPGETQWGSHYKTIVNIISMFLAIRDVLISLGKDNAQKSDWPKIRAVVLVLESFDFVFSAHLMVTMLGYTNELSMCLQRRDQDILNAMPLVSVAKNRMQELRTDGWNAFLQRLILFCNKHDINVLAMDDNYMSFGRSARFVPIQTNDDHFRREVYIGINDRIIHELDAQFDEFNMALLSCMAASNPLNSFASFHTNMVRRLAEFYPNDFSASNLIRLEMELHIYIDDMRRDNCFQCINSIVGLSVKIVQTNRHNVYDLVYLLLKLELILLVATTGVERSFSALNFVKNKLRNRMSDSHLDDCLLTFIERDIFMNVKEYDIIDTLWQLESVGSMRGRNSFLSHFNCVN